ncbi:uncharacterized protein LTR77_008334 [Saxophila tyrrhenica]|uniref:Dipeptidyl-peptidase V n=1 Tax=Saxophila tyrrhenica TaxID=1690608 RepID=A0AAV9P185_9PEZI|nr:hypothetical protein LTR77_008334 [Saxophila tyrrhenica]
MALLDKILDLPIPKTIKISPDCRQVLYSTTPITKTGEHEVSTIWLADTGHQGSARQITLGEYNDHSPRWCPDGKSIAFISDRAKAGEQWAIYSHTLGEEGEPQVLTPAGNEKKIERFEFSPDGKTIAYLSADEKSAEKKAKDKEKDDPMVWGEDWAFNRLRVVDVATKKVATLVSRSAHITELAWSDDGSRIAWLEVTTPNIESPYLHGTKASIINLAAIPSGGPWPFSTKLHSLQWAGDKLHALGFRSQESTISNNAVYSLDTTSSSPAWADPTYGLEECPEELGKADRDIVVKVEAGPQDQLHMFGGRPIFSKDQELKTWDAAFTTDSDELIIAVATSDVNHPPEVHSITASGGALIQLSSHARAHGLQDHHFGHPEFLSCASEDGAIELDAVYITPPHLTPQNQRTPPKPLPTVVFIHGGPHSRVTNQFDGTYHLWGPLLLEAGYALLLPNYHGNSGRGSDWANCARGAVGTVEYDDIIALVNDAVRNGYSDPERLVVSGWSQGGFLSYLACVRNGLHGEGWKFRAAIPGAGVSDWDTMTMTSDVGATFQSDMAGKSPWRSDKPDVANRKGSAIWEFQAAVEAAVEIPPVLMVHGEKDERVPVSQAVGFRRALQGQGLGFEMVVYPREEHIIKERRHVRDMAERVVGFVGKHLGPGEKGDGEV